jgi:hypothetical protein
MPLREPLRNEAVTYVLRDIAPRGQGNPFPWCQKQFDFVADVKLRDELATALYQARMMEKLREALHLPDEFNHGFIKSQILFYASIYEAIIDYYLDENASLPEVVTLKKRQTFKEEKSALSNSLRLTFSKPDGDIELYTCRAHVESITLKEIQFKSRLETAIEIGLVSPSLKIMIESLYSDRNSIHLIASAKREFKPQDNKPLLAFKHLRGFLAHARSWASKPKTEAK